MKTRVLIQVGLALILILAVAGIVFADTVVLKDGTRIDGIIKKVDRGKVSVTCGTETKVFDILDVESMDFTSSHLEDINKEIPLEHFLGNMEAQELVKDAAALEKATADIQRLLKQVKDYWGTKQPIGTDQLRGWEAAKEQFRKPLAAYQETLNDLYFHVLARVDEYNAMMKDARKVYVGVKGAFNVGSPLIPVEMERLPLKKYVPGNWYDTIYYEGYNIGFNEAVERYRPPSPQY